MATTLAQYTDALEQTWTGLASAVEGLTDEQWHGPGGLPGWTVKDVVSHVVGVELLMLGEPYPDHVLPDGLTHIRNDAGRWVEVPVDVRRPLPGDTVLAELREVTERRLKALRALDEAALEEDFPGLLGQPTKLKHLLGIRVFDSWAHEQDVRRALGRPGGLSSDAALLSRRRLLLAFTGLPVEAGRSVVFELADPASVATVTFGTSYVDSDTPGADARITTDFETFAMLGCGRVHWPDVSGVTVSGDTAFAEQVLRSMAITP